MGGRSWRPDLTPVVGCAATARPLPSTEADLGKEAGAIPVRNARTRARFTVARATALVACLWLAPAALAAGEPTNSSRPTISGTAQAGHLLQGNPGAWDSLTPVTYSYPWGRVEGPNCVTVDTGHDSCTTGAADIWKPLWL